MLVGENWPEAIPNLTISCSTCQRQVQPRLLVLCQHCQREVCVQCCSTHRDSVSIVHLLLVMQLALLSVLPPCAQMGQMLRTRLDALSAHEANLKLHQERLTESKRPKVRLRVGAKGGIYSAVEEVVFELRAAVSKMLNGAMARVEVAHAASLEAINGLASRATELSAEVVKTHDVRDSVVGANDMRMVMVTQKWLKGLFGDAATVGAMAEEVHHLPIAQMHVSDQLCKIDQHLNDFDLIVVEETVSPTPLPRSSTRHSIGDQRETTSPITTGTKSRVKLYVGGLQPNHTEGQLRQHFGQYGSVTECCIARNYNTDESMGFGFVTFGEVEAASCALAAGPHLLGNDSVYVRPFKLRTKKEREAEEVAVSCSPVKCVCTMPCLMNADEGDGTEEKGEASVETKAQPKWFPILEMHAGQLGVQGGVGVENKGEGSETGVRRKTNELRLFVRYREPSTSQQDLKEYFSRYGNVRSVVLIRERASGMARGIAFVEMSTAQEVEAVLEARPHQVSGESMVVRPAHRRASRKARTLKVVKPVHQLVVYDLPPEVKKKRIKKLFGQFGAVTEVRMGEKRDRAYVTFATAEALEEAVTAGACLEGVQLRVSLPDDHEWSLSGEVKVADASPHDGDCVDPVTDSCVTRQDNCGTQPECTSKAEAGSDDKVKANSVSHHVSDLIVPVTDIGSSKEGNCGTQPECKSKGGKE
ncbi:unnamed protein product [Taenia asiatica]|uniref:RRM domain-containing protein n=1 Tax=Taenia asiatica TaxID=60517 RepID=A0A0R3WF99_TAEAS|nr:unnamed protein product [Taenia asiatica]